jgi:hypothetical protein
MVICPAFAPHSSGASQVHQSGESSQIDPPKGTSNMTLHFK